MRNSFLPIIASAAVFLSACTSMQGRPADNNRPSRPPQAMRNAHVRSVASVDEEFSFVCDDGNKAHPVAFVNRGGTFNVYLQNEKGTFSPREAFLVREARTRPTGELVIFLGMSSSEDEWTYQLFNFPAGFQLAKNIVGLEKNLSERPADVLEPIEDADRTVVCQAADPNFN